MYKSDGGELWHPCETLTSKCKDVTYAVIILNTPIQFTCNPNFLLNLWSKATVRITVDGGTERWLSWLKLNNIDFAKVSPPDLITGDMDSLSQEVLCYYLKSEEVPRVIRTPDQNETDFTKALRELNKFCNLQEEEVEVVYVIADTSGRFDQIIANIHTLYKARTILPKAKVFQVASNSLTWLLTEGSHTISIPQKIRHNREWCALIPMNCCHVTTTGLKWNLDKSKMEFGALISTSNTYSGAPTVVVQTDNNIVWSMGIESLLLID